MSAKQIADKIATLSRKQLTVLEDNSRPWTERKRINAELELEVKMLTERFYATKGIDDMDALTGGLAQGSGLSVDPFDTVGLSYGIKALEAAGHRLVGPPSLMVDTPQLKEMHDAVVHGKGFRARVKELTSVAGGDLPTTEVVLPPLAFRREPTRIASLIPFTTSSAPIVTYYTTTGSSGAAPVAEGALKPTSDITYTPQEGRATKIAHRTKATDEALKDIPSFAAVMRQDMVGGVIEAENRELLSATKGGASKFNGLLNAGIQSQPRGTDTILDAIEQATLLPRIGSSYVAPDAAVMNPLDWSRIRRAKDADGNYIVGQPAGAQAPRLWEMNVVLTTGIPVGTALIGAFSDSTVGYIVDQLTIDVDRSGDDFDRNKTSIRAEERLILTVPRPSGLVKVTGLAPSA